MKVHFSPRSLQDLRVIAKWIAAERPNAARKVIRNLRATCLSLADRPYAYEFLAGREGDGIRRVPHGRYIVCYLVDGKALAILRILDSARDIPSLL